MTETLTDPTSQIHFLKITATVEVKAEQGKWIARSKSLGLVADGDTPHEAIKALEAAVVDGERGANNPSIRQYVSKKAKVETEEVEKVTIEGLSFSVDDIMEAKKARLVEMCEEVKIDSSGTVVELQNKLFEVLTAGDEKIGDTHIE